MTAIDRLIEYLRIQNPSWSWKKIEREALKRIGIGKAVREMKP